MEEAKTEIKTEVMVADNTTESNAQLCENCKKPLEKESLYWLCPECHEAREAEKKKQRRKDILGIFAFGLGLSVLIGLIFQYHSDIERGFLFIESGVSHVFNWVNEAPLFVQGFTWTFLVFIVAFLFFLLSEAIS